MSTHTGSPAFGIAMVLVAGVLVLHKTRDGIPEDAVAAAIDTLKEGASGAPADEACGVLGRHVELAYRRLVDQVRDPERRDAAPLLGPLARLADERARVVVRDVAANHGDPTMRREAVRQLGLVEDVGALALLRVAADRDPALVVRQEAVLAIARLGDDSVLYDLGRLLDPSTLPDLREGARAALLAFVDSDFGGDAVKACRWLVERFGVAPRTSVGGGPRPPVTLSAEGVSMHSLDERLVFQVDGEIDGPFHVVVEHATGTLLIEVDDGPRGLIARCSDVPDEGLSLPRHAPLSVVRAGGAASISIPRVGQLVQDEVEAVTLVR